jgi:hypothetical protein
VGERARTAFALPAELATVRMGSHWEGLDVVLAELQFLLDRSERILGPVEDAVQR